MGLKTFFLTVLTSLTLAATAEAQVFVVNSSLSKTSASAGQIVTAKAALSATTRVWGAYVDIHYLDSNGTSVAHKGEVMQTLRPGVVSSFQFDYQINLAPATYLVVVDVWNSSHSARLFIKDIGYVTVVGSVSPTPTQTPAPTPTATATPTPTVPQPDFSKLNPDCYIPNNPSKVLTLSSLFDGATWNDPHVIKVGNQFVMYASADHYYDQNIAAYRLVSNDGVNWSLNPSTPVLSKSTDPNAFDAKSVETPAVTYFNGLYYMFYTAYQTTLSDPTSYRIGYATSMDGVNFIKRGQLLAPTDPTGQPNLQFNQYIVGEPAPVVVNNKLYLYFAATGADANLGMISSIGMIETSDGSNWTAPQRVLVADQNIYPRSQNWKGYSTPHAAYLGGQVHLWVTVATDSPYLQIKIHHMASSDGKTNFVHDAKAIFDTTSFTWAPREVRAPAVIMNGTQLMLYVVGDDGYTPGIGLSRCQL